MADTAESRPSFEQFAAVLRYGLFAPLCFSPDGSEIAYTVNASGQYNVWKQGLKGLARDSEK